MRLDLRSLWLSLAINLYMLNPTTVYATVDMEWVEIGDVDNACNPIPETDTFSADCFGAVPHPYRIGKFEVTNAQFIEFLNAIAATDTHTLYATVMSFPEDPWFGGIIREGAPGSYSYESIPGRETMPANIVSFWGAARFANWLHNGKPTGLQDESTTEDGAYTLTPEAIAANSVVRNASAKVFIPNGDEWYKAAYYDPVSASYSLYPTASDVRPSCLNPPGPAPNSASCGGAIEAPDPVGSYTASPSFYGTFDQAGNLWEWTETSFLNDRRIIRGGDYDDFALTAVNSWYEVLAPEVGAPALGFRVAGLVPPPPVPALSPTGVTALLGVLCFVGSGLECARRRR